MDHVGKAVFCYFDGEGFDLAGPDGRDPVPDRRQREAAARLNARTAHAQPGVQRTRGQTRADDQIFLLPDMQHRSAVKMGNVLENTLDSSIKDRFAHTNVYTKEKCQSCWAKFFCSGGCNANNWQYAGDIANAHDISCELEKKRLECALMIKAATL